MKGCLSIEWDPEGGALMNSSSRGERNRNDNSNACLSELKHLRGLRSLEVEVSDLKLLPKDDMVFNNLINLTRYSIEIGYRGGLLKKVGECRKASTRIGLSNIQSAEMVKCFTNLLKRSEFVHLARLSDYELDINKDGFNQLKYLCLHECPAIHSISDYAFAKLEDLDLTSLDMLEGAAYELGAIPGDQASFVNLRNLRLQSCERVFASLPTNIERNLDFPRLEAMYLIGLTEIISFYFTGRSINIVNSQQDEESVAFFNDKLTLPALESVHLYSLPNVRALWHNPLPEDSFFKLRTLKLSCCHKLLSVFPLSVAKALVQLEDLDVYFCEVLEALIFVASEDQDEVEDEDLICCNLLLLFPKLTSLKLRKLPKLVKFCSGSKRLIIDVRWPLLKTLEVCYCDQLEVLFQRSVGGQLEAADYQIHQQPFFFLDYKVSLPSLEFLCIDLEKALWHNHLLVDSFSKLKELKIDSCSKLLNLLPSNILRGIQSLQILEIRNCDALEEMFYLKAINGKEAEDSTCAATQSRGDSFSNDGLSFFQNLQSFKVYDCPRLEYVFPISMAKTPMQLQDLAIECCGVETIISY